MNKKDEKKDESISPLVEPEEKDPPMPLVNDDPNEPLTPLTEPNKKCEKEEP